MSSPLDMRTMNNGGVVEAVNIALAKVADNIADVNTPPDKPRTVTLKITFKPDESRTLIASKAVVTTSRRSRRPSRSCSTSWTARPCCSSPSPTTAPTSTALTARPRRNSGEAAA